MNFRTDTSISHPEGHASAPKPLEPKIRALREYKINKLTSTKRLESGRKFNISEMPELT